MRSLRSRRRDGGTHDASEGRSLAKGPVLVIGTLLTAFGLCGLLVNSDFPSASSAFPDGTAQGETFLGIEVNGWTSWGAIAAGALLLFGLARHWMARTMALLVGLALAAAAVIAVIDGEDVLGLAAANGATKLALAITAGALLLTALLPRIGRRRRTDEPVVEREHEHETAVDETAVAEPSSRTGRFSREEAPTEVRSENPLRR